MNNPYTMHEEFDKQSGHIKKLSDLYAHALQKADKWDALVEKCAGFTPDELVQSRQFWMETARERMQAVNGMHVTIENQQAEIKNLRLLRDEQGQKLRDVNEEFAKQSRFIVELADQLNQEEATVARLTALVQQLSEVQADFAKMKLVTEACETQLEKAVEKLRSKKPKRKLERIITDVDAIEQRLSVVERRLDAHGC